MSSLNEDEIWKFIDTFYNEFSLVDHQINSYEHFVNHSLKAIIEQFNPIEIYTDIDKSPINKDISTIWCRPYLKLDETRSHCD